MLGARRPRQLTRSAPASADSAGCFRDIEAVVAQRAAAAASTLAAAAASASASASAPGASPPPPFRLPEVEVLAWRAGQPLQLSVPLALETTLGTERMLHWAGCQLQETHRAVRELGFVPTEKGVFISRWHHGSPAHRYGLYALHWVSEVNGQPTPDLDSFVAAVRSLADGADVRLKTVHLNTKPKARRRRRRQGRMLRAFTLRSAPADGGPRAPAGADDEDGPALLAHVGAAPRPRRGVDAHRAAVSGARGRRPRGSLGGVGAERERKENTVLFGEQGKGGHDEEAAAAAAASHTRRGLKEGKKKDQGRAAAGSRGMNAGQK